jgi:hypothetical protein
MWPSFAQQMLRNYKMRPKIKLSNLRPFTFNAPRLGVRSWFWGKDADGIA